ncbi:N-acetylmannosamine-6-phosphate 2-epimerase [Cohnella candidum]|uniref:Putative N-acetylmannosamine-6-phosphate 2-epimerase n=1 Tax=Cohnella candidum TaxID=2674991 RepID=A0A3G3JXP0_9BACL|nr:N-acetylmannosamine-6-phosphate 2-epimerase [Cohnella candidum]AYQ72922.1 N-acetylmannosamine-6-phosphate 2-epimerase [Cohnella candidum]
MSDKLISSLKNGLIVSCQALEEEPLYGAEMMVLMARAAEEGGAVAIRSNTPQDVAAIKKKSRLPVIGLYKKNYPGADVYITPTLREVSEILEAGADILAVDATRMARPDGIELEDFFRAIRERYPEAVILADISTFEEGVNAMELGADLVSTTMSGYTPYSPQHENPDVELVTRLSALGRVPVLAEGRIWTPEQCVACLNAGAHAVVVGTAITRPQEITRRFVQAMDGALQRSHN